MPANESHDYDLIDRLADEFAARLRRGERPSLQEYVDRYPNLGDEIRELLPAMVQLEQAQEEFGDQAEATATAVKQQPLRQLGDFHILREIGHGGMGAVYEAEQVSLGRRVALKVVTQKTLNDPKQKRRFEREAKAAAKLHHTNIVPVFGFGEHEGTPYYVMQFIQGTGLDEVINEVRNMRASGPSQLSHTEIADKLEPRSDNSATHMARSLMTGYFKPVSESITQSFSHSAQAAAPVAESTDHFSDTMAGSSSSVVLSGMAATGSRLSKKLTYFQSVARIGVQVADALEYAHQQGILHRDIKPSNLLLDVRGSTWVTDFGLAKLDDQQNLTHTGDILGTLRYMPPEAFEGRTDARSDVYSLGLTLYEMLTFRPAFGEKERAQLVKQVTTDEAPRLHHINPSIPRDLVTIIHKAVERDPSHRYATAAELAADLQRFLDDEPIKARRLSVSEKTRRWCRRNPVVAGLSATLALLLIGATAASVMAAAHFDQLAKENSETADNERQARLEEKDAKEREAGLRSEAESALKEAEKQRERAETNFDKARAAVDDYLTKVSESQLLQVPGLQPLRRELLLSALAFYQDFIKDRGDDPKIRAGLASAYLRVGKIRGELEDFSEQKVALAEALKLYKHLAEASPDEADWQHGQADCHFRLGEYPQAITIWKKLVKPERPSFQRELAEAYNSQAIGHANKGKFDLALEDHQQGLVIREMLVRLNPDDPEARRDLGATLNNLGVLLSNRQRTAEALAMYLRAVEHAEAAYKRPHPGTIYGRFLAISSRNVGYMYDKLGEKGRSVEWFEKALVIWKRLAGENPAVPSFQSSLLSDYMNLGRVYRDIGKEEEAARTNRLVRAIVERLPQEGPDNLYNLACIRAQCAEAPDRAQLTDEERAEKREHADLAMEALRKSLTAGYKDLKHLKADNDLQVLRDRADFKELVANLEATLEFEERAKKADAVAAAGKTPAEKLKATQEALALREKLTAGDPKNQHLRADHAASLHAIGLIQLDLGKTEEAAQSLARSMALRQQLAKEDTKNSHFKADLGASYLGQGDMHWKAGRLAEGSRSWQQGVDLLEIAMQSEPANLALKSQRQEAGLAVGNSYARFFMWQEAADYYRKVCQQSGNKADQMLAPDTSFEVAARYAQVLVVAGDREGYLGLCGQLLKRYEAKPNQSDGFWLAFACSQSLGSELDPVRLGKLFEKQAELAPDQLWLQIYIRNAYLRADRLEDAIRGTAQIPDVRHGRYVLAMAHHRLGHADLARHWLGEGDKSLESAFQWHYSGSEFVPPKEWWHFAELLAFARMAHELIDSTPLADDARVHLHRADCHFRLDQKDKADAEFRAAVSAQPKDPSVWQTRARHFARLGLHHRAEADFAKAIELSPNEGANWIARARYFIEQAKLKEADADYKKAASLTPYDLNKFVEGGWWVAGPYPEDLKLECPPEKEADPAKPVVSMNAAPALAWRPVLTKENGRVDLRREFDSDHMSAYAVTYIYSLDDCTALLYFGGDDLARLWVNGKLVHETTAFNDYSGLDRVPVTLRAGRNTLLAKVNNILGEHKFTLLVDDCSLGRVLKYAELGLWKEAADELAKGSKSGFPNFQSLRFASLLLAAGDTEGYRRYRKQLLGLAESPVDLYPGLEIAFACSLLAEPGMDMTRLVELAGKWKEPDPKNHWNDFFGGVTLYRAGQFEQAIALMEAEEPHDPKTWPVLALAHHHLGHAGQARKYLDKAEGCYKVAAKDVLSQPMHQPLFKARYWHDGLWFAMFYREAKTLVEGKVPDDSALKKIEERGREELRRRDKLTAPYDHALMVDFEQPRAWLARGKRYLELKRDKDAENDFVKAVELKPDDMEVWKVRGGIYSELGRPAKAADDFDRYINRLTRDEFFLGPRSIALGELNKWPEAYEKLMALRPNDKHLVACRGRDRLVHARWKEAAQDYQKVILDRPVTDEWMDAAAAFLLSGDQTGYQDLIKKLALRVEEDSSNIFGWFVLARAGSLGPNPGIEPALLIQAGKRGLGKDTSSWTLHALGLANLRAGALQEANKLFEESNASSNWDENAMSLNWLGLALSHSRAGRPDEARHCLDKARTMAKPNDTKGPRISKDFYSQDWAEFQILLREAEVLMDDKKP
ncbi:MAG: protein kinase domain-containing protein [Gemmataceae bacterium]